jgi:hypothetical protein
MRNAFAYTSTHGGRCDSEARRRGIRPPVTLLAWLRFALAARRFAPHSLRSTLAAAARNASSAPGCGSGALMSCSFGARSGMSRSARARTRVLELFVTPIPSRGYGVHLNITHGALCAARFTQRCRAALRPRAVRLPPA